MRAARVRGSSPSHLGPPKARIMSISWKAWASLGSSIIEFAGAAPRRPKTCPDATRNARTFRSHSPANFEFPRPCRRPRRGAHHEHQRDPRDAAEEGRRQWRASLKGFAFTASPSSGGPRPRPQKGPAADFRVIPVPAQSLQILAANASRSRSARTDFEKVHNM